MDFAIKTDAEALATGHYCQLAHTDDGVKLMRGADENKDQTYFLCGLTQAQLERAMFPIGALQKPRVRELAQKAGLPTASKKDSTGICFIGERNFSDLLGNISKRALATW